MKKHTFALMNILMTFAIVLCTARSGAQKVELKTWQDHMRSLSNTLIDAFPFLYSAREYRLPENKKKIIDSLTKLSTTAHTLPLKSGEALIGAEPLTEGTPLSIKDQTTEAIRLYNKQDFELSQKQVFGAVQRCFACHAAHQTGPQFPTTNSEVMSLATPNLLEKAIMFGALRQFDGILELIERDGPKSISVNAPETDSLVKLYLVVSLRSQQDFSKALTFLERIMKASKGSVVLGKWKKDIQSWKSLSRQNSNQKIMDFIARRKKTDVGTNEDSLFVVRLFETYALHKTPLVTSSRPETKAQTFLQLADSYAGMDFAPFLNLPEIYYTACTKAAPDTEAGRRCRAMLASSNQ